MKKKNSNKKNFFERFWEAFWRPEMLVLPGQIAFFLFLSVVPTLTLIGYACSYLNLSNDLVQTFLSNILSKDIASLVAPIITSTEITPAFFISLGVGYFIASNGMSSIIVASNTIYGIKDSGFFKRRLKAIIMELVIVILFLFILLVPLLGSTIIDLLHYLNLDTETTSIIVNTFNLLGGPLSWIIVFLFIKTIYTMAPDKKFASRSVNGGAIFTTIAWIGITELYSYYIANYANYSLFYGSLANIVILMLWVYFLSYAFVIGMAMNYHQDLEKTGVIEINKVIEESANSAPVLPEEPDNKKNKKEIKKENQENKS
ncbi:MAG: YihY/virulence factor BrkB family protein [Candidatus Coprovivens sp.]